MGDHIDRAVSSCASSKFALRTLRAHGLRPQELHLVARATTVASLQYASPAWWGFATEEQRNRLERLLRGLRRRGFLPVDFPSFAALATEADLRLLKSISANPYHVLRHSVRIAGGLGVEPPYLILPTPYLWSKFDPGVEFQPPHLSFAEVGTLLPSHFLLMQFLKYLQCDDLNVTTILIHIED